MRDYKKLLEAGNAAQLEKLKVNSHKQGWDNIPFEDSFNGLVDEVKELREAFENKPTTETYRDGLLAIRNKAADVANYAHMIIYRCNSFLAEEEKW